MADGGTSGHDTVQLAIMLAAAMSVAAVFSFEHGKFTAKLSWWDYHAYLLAWFGAAVYAVVQRGAPRSTPSSTC